MSFFTTIEQDFSAIKKWFEGNPIGIALENDFRMALAELEKIAAADLENAVKVIGFHALSAFAIGGPSAAIDAGIAAAITEFKVLGKDVSSRTVRTLVNSIVNHVSATTTPAPVVAP
jgi:hypothetical protein